MANTKIPSELIDDNISLGGSPTTTTQTAGDNSTKIATTAYVETAVSNLVDSAPDTLNTLNEIAAAINDNATFYDTVVVKTGSTMTGNLVINADLTVDTNTLYVDSTNNRVGIGTSSPDYNLHVEKSSASANVDLLVRNTGTDGTSNTRIMSYVSGASGGDPKIGLGITAVRDYFWRIDNSDSDKLILDTNGTDIFTIDTSGNVGIGTTASLDSRLEINATSSASSRIKLKLNDTAYCYFGGYSGIVGSGNADDVALFAWTGKELAFGSNGTERMRIASDGTLLTRSSDGLAPTIGSGCVSIWGRSGSSSTGILRVYKTGDDGKAVDFYRTGNTSVGNISVTSTDIIIGTGNVGVRFIESGQDRIIPRTVGDAGANGTIDLGDSGSRFKDLYLSSVLYCGKTTAAAFNTTVGTALDGTNGYITAARSGGPSGYFNRTTSDGDILTFLKDGTTVGSISSDSGNTSYNSNGGVIYLGGNQTNHIKILTSTATGQPRIEPSADGTTDLGRVALRFKDLFLSGGVYVGGTTSANYLDDYEEGTWTPVIHSTGGAVSASYSYRSAYYIKIGNSVYVRWGFLLSSISGGSGHVEVTGLPFTSKNYGPYQQPSAFVNAQNLTTDPDGPVLFYVVDNGTKLQGRLMNNADTGLPISYFQNGSWCIGNVTYDVS